MILSSALGVDAAGARLPSLRNNIPQEETLKMELFPALTNDQIAAMSDEELADVLSTYQETADKVVAGDEKTVGDLTVDQLAEQMAQGAAVCEAIMLEQDSREEKAQAEAAAEEDQKAQIVDLASKFKRGEEDDPEDDAEVVDGEVVDDPAEVVAASATPSPRRRKAGLPAAKATPTPATSADDSVEVPCTILAGAGLKNVVDGGVIRDPLVLAEAFMQRNRNFGGGSRASQPQPGDGARAVVATMHKEYPDTHVLSPADGAEVLTHKVRAAMRGKNHLNGNGVLVASGGLCAPVDVKYEIDSYGTDARPVRDALPRFQASRGGLRFAPALGIASIDVDGNAGSATKVVSMSTDAGGGYSKPSQTVTCPSFTEVDVNMISRSLTFGNAAQRFYPELIDEWIRLVGVAWAQQAEVTLINSIKAASTAVTAATATAKWGAATSSDAGAALIVGATTQFTKQMLLAVASFRSRLRDDNLAMTVMVPFWLADLIAADIGRAGGAFADRIGLNRQAVMNYLNSLVDNVDFVFYLDSPSSGTSQFLPGPVSGSPKTFPDWPTDVQWGVFPTGSFIYLDGGDLDLGIVRDSTLNATNDMQTFAEGFEGVAFTGLESWWVTSALNDTGADGGVHGSIALAS